MIAFVAVVCALLGVPAGILANLYIERSPDKQPLQPLPSVRRLTGTTLYRLVIVATCALFAGAALRFDAGWEVPAYLVFFTCLVAITVIDFQLQIIPNRIVYPTIFASVPLLALAAVARGDWDRFGQALLGATLAWLALLALHLISPAGMGFGDVRLAFVLGLFLGWIDLGHVVTGLFLGVLLIAVVGIVLAVLRLRSIQEHIAFGPFLAAGSTVAVFAGNAIIQWWTG